MRELGDLSSWCRISDRFGKWRLRQSASASTIPRHCRMWSSDSHFSGRDQGLTLTVLGGAPQVCSWGSLQLSQKAPLTVALTSLGENILGTPQCEFGYILPPPGFNGSLNTDTVPSGGLAKNPPYLPLMPQSQKEGLLCACGVPESEVIPHTSAV